uniref:Uncharacterized protein MLCB1610.18 n=1 Tax=Mycobacterium leprae TaxID=1769 RepID=Q9X7B6_MYCLR|nr:hypothetical protein MLCB1610.18 [Mycobacterium leprae]
MASSRREIRSYVTRSGKVGQVLGSAPRYLVYCRRFRDVTRDVADGICTDSGIYYQPVLDDAVILDVHSWVRFVPGHVDARTVIPRILDMLAEV